jgi:hypothetical protein
MFIRLFLMKTGGLFVMEELSIYLSTIIFYLSVNQILENHTIKIVSMIY